jgi:nucleotide-binding universal stress UspA family protein
MQKLRRLLVPTDFSGAAHNAFATALELASGLGAEVTVLHVWQPRPGISLTAPTAEPGGKTVSDVVRREAARKLGAWVGRSRCSTRVELGAPAELIVTLAASEGHDLIVLGSTGAGSASSGLGSVALRVLGAAHCPVLVYPDRTGPHSFAGKGRS